MRALAKKILNSLPIFVKVFLISLSERYFRAVYFLQEKREYTFIKKEYSNNPKKRILVYHLTGLLFGGTEKNLQIIANDLAQDYDVYYMYSNRENKDSREAFMDPRITLIKFNYSFVEKKHPYYIHAMDPHIKNIITEHGIDLIIISESGHSIYPELTIKETPIIMVNNFGSPALQKNIVHINYVSNKVKEYAHSYTGNKMKYSVLNTPTTGVIPRDAVRDFRKELGILDTDFVFGRIGRNSDSIFDPIGIRAFQSITKEYPEAKYLIMAPPPILEKIVTQENIPNVYFIKPSYDEKDVWAFHYTLDCLAHFRYDGESLGLNIAESMKVGNPIISHRSRIWNAHTDYLDRAFSRVASLDNVAEYASYMKEFIDMKTKQNEKWLKMRKISQQKGEELFSKDSYMRSFKEIIKSHLH